MKPFPDVRLSISTRLALWYGLSLLILLSLFVLFLYTSFHVSLHQDFNDRLRREQQQLLQAFSAVGRDAQNFAASDVMQSGSYLADGEDGTYVRLLSHAGRVLYRSPNFAGIPEFDPVLPDRGQDGGADHTWRGAPARSLYAPVLDREGMQQGWLEVTRLESSLHREMHRLGWLLGVGVLLGTAIAMASGHRLARRALRPVAALTEAANRIQAEDLGSRLPTDFGVRDEMTDLAETFNALLVRLDASFERERRFRADAAHEMFTPLAALRSEVDVALRRPRGTGEYEQALRAVREHAHRLTGIVERLLQLSRAEGLDRPEAAVTNASDAARQVAERFSVRAYDRGVRLEHELQPDVQAAIDPAHLEAVLENLLDNAIKYTPEGGRIIVRVHAEDGKVVLCVTDTGAGLSEEEREHLFDRFYRADRDAVQQARGSGLGLSIARAIVDVYGGQIVARSAGPHCGSTFEVRLPTAGPGCLIVEPVNELS